MEMIKLERSLTSGNELRESSNRLLKFNFHPPLRKCSNEYKTFLLKELRSWILQTEKKNAEKL